MKPVERMCESKVRDFATQATEKAPQDGSEPDQSDVGRRETMNASIKSAFEATGIDSSRMTKEARFPVSLASKPISLYYDQKYERLHVLLDLTLVRSAKDGGRETPVGVVDPKSLRVLFGKTMSFLHDRVDLAINSLGPTRWAQLHDSLCTGCRTLGGENTVANGASLTIEEQKRLDEMSKTLLQECRANNDQRQIIETSQGLTRQYDSTRALCIASGRGLCSEEDAGRTEASCETTTTALVSYDIAQDVTQRLNAGIRDMLGFNAYPRLRQPDDQPICPGLVAGPEFKLKVSLLHWPWGECHQQISSEGCVPPAVPEVGQDSDDEDFSEEE